MTEAKNPKEGTYLVFSLRTQDGQVKYIGVTMASVQKRLQDMLNGARNARTAQYNQPVSEWLREMYDTFKTPQYKIEGTFDNKKDAEALKRQLIKSHTDLTNVDGNYTSFIEAK